MTCQHGFIGACAECDGSGQQPEQDEDTLPRASEESVRDTVADTARALARLWTDATPKRPLADTYAALVAAGRRDAIADAARACGPQVEAAFRALVTGDATREVGR